MAAVTDADDEAQRIQLRVNGAEHVLSVAADRVLLDVLRDDLGLTGTKESCGIGVCGACTVRVDGRPLAACITLAVVADGAEITTIEGVAAASGACGSAASGPCAPGSGLDLVQQAFVAYGGLQCGFCTPGMVMAASALLAENSDPSDAEICDWMTGNLCRCTGYYKIVESVRQAARALRSARS